MGDKWRLDFSQEIIEADATGNINQSLWDLWCENNSKIIILKRPDALLISTAPNSGIHIYFNENGITDSLDKITCKELSQKNARKFLAFGYFPGAATLYKDIFCLPQGYYLCCEYSENRIHLLPINLDCITFMDRTLDEAIWNSCLNVLEQPYNKIWLALSGGLDSSVLFYCLKTLEKKVTNLSLNLLNVYADGGRDETRYLDILLKHEKYNLHRFCINENDAWEAFLCHAARDEIFGFPIILKYEYMMRTLRKAGVKLLVMGDGPDEAFVCRKTYEPYLNHEKSIFLPIHKKIREEGVQSATFSKIAARNIWAQYNMVFQGATNVRFLQNAAKNNGIILVEPYLDQNVQEWCVAHAIDMVKSEEKEPLKKYADGKIPRQIVCRSKLGYNSDYALWNAQGGRFYEELNKRLRDSTISGQLIQYQKQVEMCLFIEEKKKYNPQERTGGIGEQGFLFSFLLLDEFIKNHWK